MYAEVPSIIPVFFDLLAAQREWVQGYQLHPRGAVFRLDHVSLAAKARPSAADDAAPPRARVSPGYVLKRLALIGYTLLVVSLIVFAITQILPADAAVMLLGENATPEALAAVRERLGLDAPVWMQYGHWLGGVLHGDFGISMRTGQPVGPRCSKRSGARCCWRCSPSC